MDSRDTSLWSRRANTQKPTLSTTTSDHTKSDSHSRGFSTSKRFTSNEPTTPGRANTFGGIPALNTSTASVSSPGAGSAFGLGSGAFASFGSATKTPKTPGTAFDFKTTTSTANTPLAEPERSGKPGAKGSQQENKATGNSSITNGISTKSSWPLKTSWVIWYRPPASKNSDYEKSIKPMYKMSTAQEFWRVYTHMKRPSALPVVSDYHLFKENIRPMWEDEENKQGGKWIIRLKKGVIDRYWEDVLLAVMGDQFAEAGEEVCGMVVSVRSGEDVFSVWTKNDGGRNIKIRETIKRVLSLPIDTVIVWKSHDDSIAQRSAIDQARQEKGVGEKRRVNNENTVPAREKTES